MAATALGIAMGIGLAGGPASAHEGSTATTVAVAAGTSAGSSPAGDALPGRAEYSVSAPGMAREAEGEGWFGLLAMVAATGVVAVGATAAAVVVWGRRGARPPWPGRLQVGAAVALLFTGVAHCALAPSHFAEGWHLGAFFVASGLLLLGQAVLVCVRPSQAAYRSVVASTVVIIALYVLGRQLTLPLVGHREAYLLEDLPVKVAEVVAAGLAIAGLMAWRRGAQPVSSETLGSAGAMSVSALPVPLPTGFSPSM